MKLRVLDLFCGAGGCSAGYERAGFEVVGVDIEPQLNYPFEFIQADALAVLGREMVCGVWRLADFDAIHASPPCQGYSVANNIHNRADHPLLIDKVRELLTRDELSEAIPPAYTEHIGHFLMREINARQAA